MNRTDTKTLPSSLVPVLLALILLIPAPSRAATWTEFGDAGPMLVNANVTVGSGLITTISGTFLSEFDIDMYCFRIADKTTFSASRNCAAISEPDLYLFSTNGNGVSLHDGCVGGLTQVTGAFVPSNGIYYLAVAASEQDARNALNQLIWNSPPATQRPPDGPGAPGPLSSWTGTPLPVSLNYTITLTGTVFCDSPVATEEHTWSGVKTRHDLPEN